MRAAIINKWVFAIAMGAVLCQALHVHAARPSEYEVKAVFLYNFAKFVEWPEKALPDTATSLIIGILGDDPFDDAFASIQDKQVKGRRLVIRRFTEFKDLQSCHILFVSTSEQKHLSQIIEHLDGSSTLMVSEIAHFTQNGGMINFILQENKVRFEINVDAAEQVGLKLSAKLLKLARIVQVQRRGGQE